MKENLKCTIYWQHWQWKHYLQIKSYNWPEPRPELYVIFLVCVQFAINLLNHSYIKTFQLFLNFYVTAFHHWPVVVFYSVSFQNFIYWKCPLLDGLVAWTNVLVLKWYSVIFMLRATIKLYVVIFVLFDFW